MDFGSVKAEDLKKTLEGIKKHFSESRCRISLNLINYINCSSTFKAAQTHVQTPREQLVQTLNRSNKNKD